MLLAFDSNWMRGECVQAQGYSALNKCIQTINVAKTATDRQNEGARIINMCFANAPVAVAA